MCPGIYSNNLGVLLHRFLDVLTLTFLCQFTNQSCFFPSRCLCITNKVCKHVCYCPPLLNPVCIPMKGESKKKLSFTVLNVTHFLILVGSNCRGTESYFRYILIFYWLIFYFTWFVQIIPYYFKHVHIIFTAPPSAPGLVSRKRKRDKYVHC